MIYIQGWPKTFNVFILAYYVTEIWTAKWHLISYENYIYLSKTTYKLYHNFSFISINYAAPLFYFNFPFDSINY